jgi:hypothetical protein
MVGPPMKLINSLLITLFRIFGTILLLIMFYSGPSLLITKLMNAEDGRQIGFLSGVVACLVIRGFWRGTKDAF